MRTVGVRELRQRAGELLRLVEAGESIEITYHGRPVAVLSPIPAVSPLERWRATGEVSLAVGDLDDLGEPMYLPAGVEAPSAVVSRLRRSER
jgi:prevent-host-death family protein